MTFLWTIDDMVKAMNGRPRGTMPEGITGISIDSRSVKPGEAFFAIKGDRVDGHDFAGIAAGNGASVLVVSEGKIPALGRILAPMIVVDDVLHALERLGRAARSRSAAQIIAVTGSVGKTTTKEMLRHVLSACGTVHASVASFNNHWGVPLTLARMPKDVDFGIFEIGMNHPDEIRPLVKMVRPQVAIITTIAGAHMGNFSSMEEIALAKAEIMEGLTEDGHVLLNRDNDQYEVLEKAAHAAQVAHIHTFGSSPRAEFRLAEFNGSAESSVVWASLSGHTYELQLGIPGRHIAENAVAVLGAVLLAGADMNFAVAAFATLSPEKGRGQRHRLAIGTGSFQLIDESYNANPASMRAAIALLQGSEPGEGGRRIAVLGDMLEMGSFAQSLHAGLADPLRQAGITTIWLAGPEMAALQESIGWDAEIVYRETAAELQDFVLDNVRAGDVVMVKSSNGMGFGKIIAALLDKYKTISDTVRTEI